MIRKTIVAGLLCFGLASLSAQINLKINIPQKENTKVSPLVKEKLEEYATQINNIIQQEKVKMEAEIKLVNKKLEENVISFDEAEIQKKKIADRYSEIIDDRIENLGFDIDEVVGRQVKYSLFTEDANNKEELQKKLIKKYKATRSVNLYLAYGAMTFSNDQPKNLVDLHKGYSNNLEFGMKFNYQLSAQSPWAIISGFGFSWRTLRLEDDYMFTKNEAREVIVTQSAVDLDKSKLRTGYIMVPLGLQFNFSPLKTVGENIKYRNYYKGAKLGANVYGGVRMSSNNIIKGEHTNTRKRDNYGVNPYVYGAQITLGYNNWNLFVKKDFSNYFDNAQFNNTKMLQFGISHDF